MIAAADGQTMAYPARGSASGVQASPGRSSFSAEAGERRALSACRQGEPETIFKDPRSTKSSEHPQLSYVVSLRPVYGHTGSSGSFLSGVTN